MFYRAATQETARRLGLTGWARNLADGDVELVACGDAAKLKELEQWLWQGPPRARVAQVHGDRRRCANVYGFYHCVLANARRETDYCGNQRF